MSRRHHGRVRHGRARADDGTRTRATVEPRDAPPARPPAGVEPRQAVEADEARPLAEPAAAAQPMAVAEPQSAAAPAPPAQQAQPDPPVQPARSGCTAPQLRRFIKSRPYVPMHELRRRFGINGPEDDVHPLQLDSIEGPIFVGLPERECALLGELVRGGEVGYELSLDPRTPIVVGVYPMRPVPRT